MPVWKAQGQSGTLALGYFGPYEHFKATGLHSEDYGANCLMVSIKRAAAAIAAILVREGVDYAQSKAVFKAARERAGLRAAPEHRGGVDRLTVEEELRFLDHAYFQNGRTGLMLQTLLETGAKASELVQLRVEDVSLVERVVTIRQGKGGKRREVPIRRDQGRMKIRVKSGHKADGWMARARLVISPTIPRLARLVILL